MLFMKVNSIVILNFHWDLLYIVDMSECEKGSFGKSASPKPQRQPFFPVISTSSLSTHLFSPTGLFQVHLPPNATAMCERTSKWGHSIFVRFLGKMSTDRERWHDVCAHVQVNVPWRNIMGVRKYVNVIAPPHPTPRNIYIYIYKCLKRSDGFQPVGINIKFENDRPWPILDTLHLLVESRVVCSPFISKQF